MHSVKPLHKPSPETSETRLTPPRLLSYQQAFLYNGSRFTVVVACTKAGKTWPMIWWIIESGLTRRNAPPAPKGANYWWVAPVYAQARIAHRRAKETLRAMFAKLPRNGEGHYWRATETPLLIEFPLSGSRLEFRSGEIADNLYGEDVHGMVIDEATRIGQDAWIAAQSTGTATRCVYKIIGNQTGRNWVTDLIAKVETGQAEDTLTYKITYVDALNAGHPQFSQAEYERIKATTPEAVFNTLYMCELADDESNPFGNGAIRACASLDTVPPPDSAVYFGIDVAKTSDYTVVVGLTATGEVAVFERFNRAPWPEITSRIAGLVGGKLATMDTTGVGSPVYDVLKPQCPNLQPCHYSPAVKQELMTKLATAIQSGKLKWHPEAHKVITLECESFEAKVSSTGAVSYNARAGLHDDAVNALALASRTFEMHQTAHFVFAF